MTSGNAISDLRHVSRTVFAVAFLGIVMLFAFLLTPNALRGRVRDLASKFPAKRFFVELNGGTARCAGRRWCNTVYRSPNGVLLSELGEHCGDIDVVADGVSDFANRLRRRNVPYMFVLAPAKIDMKCTMLPSAFVHRGNERADKFRSCLQGRGIEVVDIRAMLTESEGDLTRYFYKTDHHWNNDAVFRVFGVIAPEIARRARVDFTAAEPFVSPDSWKRDVVRQCFMGTKARRTGRLFGGLDDMTVYQPRFSTDMVIDIPSKNVRRRGSFRKTVMWRAGKVLGNRGDVFATDAYSMVYIGGNYGVVRHENRGAPIKLRLMIIGDSYARPLEAFLSTVFSDVIALDQRRFDKGDTVASHVEGFKPDIVVQLNNPSALGGVSRKGSDPIYPVLFSYGCSE